MRMICSNCGTEAPDKAKYCPKCGAGLSANGQKEIIGPGKIIKAPHSGSQNTAAKDSNGPGRTLKAAFGGKIKLPALIAIIAAAVVVVVVAIVLMPPNSNGASEQESVRPITVEPLESDSFVQVVDYPLVSYEVEAEDSNGYKVKYKASVGSWVKASDIDISTSIWRQLGGIDVPVPVNGDQIDYPELPRATTAYCFGTFEIENLTPSFPVSSFAGIGPLINFGCIPETKIGYTYLNVQLGNAITHYDSACPGFQPNMQADYWGPAPFYFVVKDAFTPNDPNGDMLEEIMLMYLSGIEVKNGDAKEFKIRKSWEAHDQNDNGYVMIAFNEGYTIVDYYGVVHVIIDDDGEDKTQKAEELGMPVIIGLDPINPELGAIIKTNEDEYLLSGLDFLKLAYEENLAIKKLDLNTTIPKAYIFDRLVIEGELNNMENSINEITGVVADLNSKGIERGTIHVGVDVCSFSPE